MPSNRVRSGATDGGSARRLFGDDGYSLNLDHHLRTGEAGAGDEGAARIVSLRIEFVADLDEARSMARIDDVHQIGTVSGARDSIENAIGGMSIVALWIAFVR